MTTDSISPPAKQPGAPGVWSVGDPLHPVGSDPMFTTEAAARAHAKTLGGADRIAAVWDGPECVALYWQHRSWLPS